MRNVTELQPEWYATGPSRRAGQYDEIVAFDQESWDGESGRRGARMPRGGRSPGRIRARGGRAPQRRPIRRRRRRPRIIVGQRALEPPPPDQGTEYLRWVQNALNQILGRQLKVNGIAGPETRDAVREFQKRERLPVSGFVGPKTEQALSAALSGAQPPDAPPEGNGAAPPEPSNAELEMLEGAWQGETNRRSRLYVRWVQQSLNKVLGLRLAEDGIMGPATRSAVRHFQQKFRLSVDGVVGPQTERTLVAAGAGNPPSGVTSTGAQPAIDTSSLRSNIINLANQEWQRWQQGRTKESDTRMHGVLADYWQTGAGWRPNDAGWWSKHPWSAAFISWIMRKAGAGNAFKYSAAHAVYTKAAKDNRLAKNSNPFKAYRTGEVKPQPGDLVCKSRASSGATYDNIREGMATHCDIVTEVQPGRLTTIGGNVSDSVSKTPVQTDANGYVISPGYFAVIRLEK